MTDLTIHCSKCSSEDFVFSKKQRPRLLGLRARRFDGGNQEPRYPDHDG